METIFWGAVLGIVVLFMWRSMAGEIWAAKERHDRKKERDFKY